MKRIVMMVLRNLIFVPYGWIKLCYYARHVDKYTEEERYRLLKYIDSKANKGVFNAMPPMSHRAPGLPGAALDRSEVTCELICDGGHIDPIMLRNAFRLLGQDRACVISDSMRAAGLGPGTYELGGQTVYVKENGRYAVLEDGTIAASITDLFTEFKNLLRFGIDFETALRSCTINPARAIGMDDQIGSIATGKYADLLFVDEDLNVAEVYVDGIQA